MVADPGGGTDVVREASCRCGQLSVCCVGEPVRISVCHCLNCQKRSGSAFAAQARFPADQVTISGEAREWVGHGDSGSFALFRFCPTCGSTVYYTNAPDHDQIAVAIGAFADPAFPAPYFSVYEGRKHRWVEITGDAVERYD